MSSPNATTEQLQELCQHLQDSSPVRACPANPIAVEATLAVV